MLTLAGFAALAALMLNLGLILTVVYPDCFDVQAAASRMPQVVILEEEGLYSQAQADRLRANRGVTAVEHEPALMVDQTQLATHDGVKQSIGLVVTDASTTRRLDVVVPRPGARPLTDVGAWLPSQFAETFGYSIGDKVTLDLGTTSVTYTALGFVDDVTLGPAQTGRYRIVVNHAAFTALADQLPHARVTYLKVTTTDLEAAESTASDFRDANYYQPVLSTEPQVRVMTYTQIKDGRLFMGNTLAVVILAFAGLVMVVSLLVVRFRVISSINETMTDIGVLKAMGYTSGQVAGSLLTQLVVVTAVGAGAGIGATYAVLPAVARGLERQSALTWTPGFAPGPTLAAFAVVTAMVAVVTGVVVARIRTITPLRALRSEVTVSTKRNNRLPLARTPGPLTGLLAVKAALQAKSQIVTVGAVVAAVGCMGTITVAVYQNIGGDSDTFVGVVAGELPDLYVQASPDVAEQVRADMAQRDDVRKAFLVTRAIPLRVDGTSTTALSTGDFSLTEGTMLYQGRWPHRTNEIAISWRQARTLGASIGDAVEISSDTAAAYVVTGLIQTFSNGGTMIALTTDGMRRVVPDFHHDAVNVYLGDPKQARALADQMEHDYAGTGLQVFDTAAMAETQVAGFRDMLRLATSIVLAVVVAVSVLVVFLVLSMAVQRSHRDLGIQMAVGYTTGQLVRQIVTTYLPAVAVGAVVGGVAGQIGFPTFIDAVFRTMNIYTARMQASVLTTAGLTVGLVTLSGVVAVLVAARVRKISPYFLVAES